MDLIDYEEHVKCENAAKKYLLQFCWKNHQRFCPKCRNRKNYKLADGRRRCSRCGYTFHDFSRRFIGTGNLSCRDWLRILKLFELELPATVMTTQLRMASNTLYKALAVLRQAIAATSVDAAQLWNYGITPERLRARRDSSGVMPMSAVPVFGIVEHGDSVFADILHSVDAEAVIHFKRNFHLRTAYRGGVIYTDPYRHYGALVFCAPRRGLPPLAHSKDDLAIDLTSGFWPFARERLARQRGVSAEHFPLYLKELEFRYNNRDSDIFSLLASRLCAFVPEYEKD